MITLEHLNNAAAADFTAALGGIFEHSAWVAGRVAGLRPFASGIALHRAMCEAVLQAEPELQLVLIRSHPELAGRAAIRGDLTAASSDEQKGAGLAACSPLQYQRLQALNLAYTERFGFPFVLAVKGHTPDSVIATLEARVVHSVDAERSVAMTEICRIARFRLTDLVDEPLGTAIISMADDLAAFSETPDGLTCSYLTPAHRATATRIKDFMLAAGLIAHIDAVGNVVGVLPGDGSEPEFLLTGSHYDTVVNAGRYDGRLGIVLPIALAGSLRRAGHTLPYPLEIIAFAEEEGVRFKSTFLGSRAIVGQFDAALLDSVDAGGVTLRDALHAGGCDPGTIGAIARDPARVAAFVEVHIEQGPVLLDAALAVGVVTGIAGSVRSMVTVTGLSGHSGTVPMALRHDAAAAAAEIVLSVERCCNATPGLVGTVGKLDVPGGAMNVIPGRCELSIDIRSAADLTRDAADAAVVADMQRIASRRGVQIERHKVLEIASVPCSPTLVGALSDSVRRTTGARALCLPSGAGHDAMMMANLTAVGMLFVRCGNGGISHNPAESLSAADAEVAARVFQDFLQHFKGRA